MQYHDFIRHYNVSRETFEKLSIYHDLLVKWQKKINLISPNTIHQIWERHFLDSLQLASHTIGHTKTLDIGSGAGLPAIPLAIETELNVTLVESDERKCLFLEEVRRSLSLDVHILNQRIEAVSRETFDMITARACASLGQLFEWSAPFLSPQGKCLFPKGERYAMEIEEASTLWDFRWEAHQSITNPKAAIISITNLKKR